MKRVEPPTFRKQNVPSNYVPGLGRGAIGFTTRSDIGPAKLTENENGSGRGIGFVPNFGQAPEGYVPGAGRGTGGFGEIKPNANSTNTDGADYSETNYDKFSGFSASLFSGSTYDDADKEADETWAKVDEDMANRRKKRPRSAATTTNNPEPPKRVADQFADLKQSLGDVSYEEWDAIPESVTGIRAHKKQDWYGPVNDSMILQGAGLSSSLNEERGRIIENRLDESKNTVGKSIDADGYINSLDSREPSVAPVGDIKKARLLFRSVTTSNPQHAPGWIAAARLEEAAGQLLDARKIIQKGCEKCPTSEEVWIEAARLNTPANAKIILANAIQQLPKSVLLWLRATEIEGTDEQRKRRVLRRGLEEIPNSEKLWKAAIELESDPTDAKILLARAVECVPLSVDMWLALTQLESYDNAKNVLNQARKHLPTEIRIWFAACTLEEANQSENLDDRLDLILTKALKRLSQPENMIVDRDTWIEQAKVAEEANFFHTCHALVRNVISLGIDKSDRKRIWFDDASLCIAENRMETARAIYTTMFKEFPGDKSILMRAVAFEKKHGKPENLHALLQEAVKECPEAQFFWLLAAKETWKRLNDVEGARNLLSKAFDAGHNSEDVWLAAVKLEWETNQILRARGLLQKARLNCPTARVWLKSILLERVTLMTIDPSKKASQADIIRNLLQSATENYPNEPKLWLMYGQFELEIKGDNFVANARKHFLDGLHHNPNSISLWLSASELELNHVSVVKARSVLEMARLKNPLSDELWLASIRLERKHEPAIVSTIIAKAMKSCPKSGLLWADQILHAPKPKQRTVSLDAMQNCDDNANVFMALGTIFARDKKLKVARKWFEKAVEKDTDLGDAWAKYTYFESAIALDTELASEVAKRCVEAEPRHGEIWQSISKQDKNLLLGTQEILQLVVAKIGKQNLMNC